MVAPGVLKVSLKAVPSTEQLGQSSILMNIRRDLPRPPMRPLSKPIWKKPRAVTQVTQANNALPRSSIILRDGFNEQR